MYIGKTSNKNCFLFTDDGTVSKKVSQEVCGVVAIMFDAMLESWIVPVLRMCIGIGNGILKQFLDFVDVRVENLPEVLVEKRLLITEA